MEHVRHLRAMGVGDILDETIRLYRQNFRTFAGISALLLPVIILQMIQTAIAGTEQTAGRVEFITVSSIVIGILYFIAYALVEAALILAISERYLGRVPKVKAAWSAALGRVGRMVKASFLCSVLVVLMAMTVVGLPFAVYYGIRWSLFLPATILEATGARRSLSRSSELVRGRWWRTFGILILASLLQLIVFFPLGIVSGLVARAFIYAMGPLGAVYAITIVNAATIGVATIVAAPLTLIAYTLLYYDLRIRKEGFDLQLLAQQLGQR